MTPKVKIDKKRVHLEMSLVSKLGLNDDEKNQKDLIFQSFDVSIFKQQISNIKSEFLKGLFFYFKADLDFF